MCLCKLKKRTPQGADELCAGLFRHVLETRPASSDLLLSTPDASNLNQSNADQGDDGVAPDVFEFV